MAVELQQLLKLSVRRWRLIGSTLPMRGSSLLSYPFDAKADFLSALGLGVDATPSTIVSSFNNDKRLLTKTGGFALDFLKRNQVTYPQFAKDPTTVGNWTLKDKRAVITQKKSTSDGHHIYSGMFEPNTRKGISEQYSAGLHFISTFPAGGGCLLPKDLYKSAIANGRALQRFPKEILGQNADRIRDYTVSAYKANKPLTGEIAILGNNAVQIMDHAIFPLDGGVCQIMRPLTMANHIFYNGHAIWVTVEHPSFPFGSMHMYIGHGKSDVSLAVSMGDRLNTASGIPTFKDVFRSGVTSWENMDQLLKDHGDRAYQLALDPEIALIIDQYLGLKDPALLCDRKVLTALDNRWAADGLRFFNPYTPPSCYTKSFLEARAVGTEALAALGDPTDECDVAEIDLDQMIAELTEDQCDTATDINAVMDKFPLSKTAEPGLVHADGSPYTMDVFTEVLFMAADEDNVFTLGEDGLWGQPLDHEIARVIRDAAGDKVDWKQIQERINASIDDGVRALVEATAPFADGSAVADVSERFSTPEFTQSIHDQLRATLTESLGPLSAGFYDAVASDPLFKGSEQEVMDLLKSYPFVDAVASQVFTAMTQVDATGSSFFESSVRASVTKQKEQFFETPAQKTDAQKEIAARIAELGDVAAIDKQLTQTGDEIAKSLQQLAEVNEKLLQTPDDAALQSDRATLEKAIQDSLDEQRELQDKQAEAAGLNDASAETDPDHLRNEGADADRHASESGDRIFTHPE